MQEEDGVEVNNWKEIEMESCRAVISDAVVRG